MLTSYIIFLKNGTVIYKKYNFSSVKAEKIVVRRAEDGSRHNNIPLVGGIIAVFGVTVVLIFTASFIM